MQYLLKSNLINKDVNGAHRGKLMNRKESEGEIEGGGQSIIIFQTDAKLTCPAPTSTPILSHASVNANSFAICTKAIFGDRK
jgi:hypothetical protein